MLSLNREHSKAQRTTVALSRPHKAAYNQVRADQIMYQTKYVCKYAHASSRLFSWSTELLEFVSRLFAPKMLDHLLHTSTCHSYPFFLPTERSGRNRTRREAPYITYQRPGSRSLDVTQASSFKLILNISVVTRSPPDSMQREFQR